MDVIVVGAGLGGLAAAIAVRRAGHRVTVLERSPSLREAGAAIGIMPNGVLALDALGLGGPVRELAAPLDAGGGLRDRHGRALLAADQARVAERTGAPLAVVPRRWLHGRLVDALPAGTIRTGCAVDGLGEQGGRVEVRAPDGQAVDSADAVVLADGAGSRLRARLLPDHPGLAGSGEHAARAVVPAPTGVPLVAGELLDHRSGERFGCLPMAAGGVYWYSTWRVAAPEDSAARHRWLRARRADWHPCAPALIDATAPQDVHVVETVQLVRPLPVLAVGPVALLGDAAHAMTPDLAQGACQAFEDAVVLGRVLADIRTDGVRAEDVRVALARYDRIRRPRVTALQRQARRMNRVLGWRGPRARVRDAALRLVPQAWATRALVAQFGVDPGRSAEPNGGLPASPTPS